MSSQRVAYAVQQLARVVVAVAAIAVSVLLVRALWHDRMVVVLIGCGTPLLLRALLFAYDLPVGKPPTGRSQSSR